MALYKTSMEAVVRHSRLFSIVATKARESWFANFKELPIFSAEGTSRLNNEQWTKLRNEMLEAKPEMQTPSADMTIMQLCFEANKLSLGKSYVKYLKDIKYDMNTAIIGKYLQLLYSHKETLTDEDLKDILSTYDELRLKYPLLDPTTAESCVLAISLTERWKEIIDLLEMIKITCTASAWSYSSIIVASCKNEEPDIAWKYFNEMVELKKSPHSEAYTAYIDYCVKKFKDAKVCVEEIGRLFNFMAKYELLPNELVMEHVKRCFEKLGWSGTFTNLTKVGVCLNCKHNLEALVQLDKDFADLSKTVLDRVIVGNNVYNKTTPVELNKFIKFVDKTKPYDVVIDGLNVAYKTKKFSVNEAAKQLATLVRYYADKNQVILVLGRKHMLGWNQMAMSFIKKNAFLFLTDNLSADDPCLLYATLVSGPKATFVSSDLMRQHKFILKDTQLQRKFKQWQLSHQCFVEFRREKLIVIPPLNYLPVAQSSKNCWHIPYRHSTAPLTESYVAPSEWLCLERRNPHS